MSSSILAPRPTDRPPPHEPWGRGVAVSVVAHALLIAALWWGVHWHNNENEGASAELWAAIPEAAAPPAAAPPPPPPAPAPAPAPEPAPAPPPPPPVAAPKAPDIVTEQLKEKQKQQQLREQQEKLEQQQKLAQQKAEQAKAEAQKKAEQQKQAQQQKELDAKIIAKLRAQNLAAMQAQLSGAGVPMQPGTAAQSRGPSADYAGRIKARVRPNIVFDNSTIAGNPEADVEVRCSPDGTIIGRRIVKSSGVAAYDDAVLRALDRTQVLPRDKDGSIPTPMTIAFHPQDQ